MTRRSPLYISMQNINKDHTNSNNNNNNNTDDCDDEYLQHHGIHTIMKNLAFDLIKSKPANHLTFMVQWLTNAAKRNEGNEDKRLDSNNSAMTTVNNVYVDNIHNTMNNNLHDISSVSLKTFKLAEFLPSKEFALETGPIGWSSAYDGESRRNDCARRSGETFIGNTPLKAQKSSDVSFELSPRKKGPLYVHMDPDVYASTKHLIDIVHRLPLSEHVAACVFLEGLIDKKHTRLPLSNFQTMLESSTGATLGKESQVNISGDMPWRSPVIGHSFTAAAATSYATDTTFTCAPLQELMNDALTTSIIAREPIELEGKETALTLLPTESSYPLYQPSSFPRTDSLMSLSPCHSKNYDIEQRWHSRVESFSSCDAKGHQVRVGSLPISPCMDENRGRESRFLLQSPLEEELIAVREGFLNYEPCYGFDETQMEGIIRKMERHTVACEEIYVFKDELIFLCSGVLLIQCKGRVFRRMTTGDFFGRLKMPHDVDEQGPYDIRAVSNAVFLSMRHKVFYELLDNERAAHRSMFLKIIYSSKLLNMLSNSEYKRLADSLRVRNFKPGSLIIQKGRPVEWFSLIMSGTVVRTLGDKNETINVTEKNDSKCANNNDFSLEFTTGHVLAHFELLFGSDALTNAIALTHVTVAQLHLVYFRAIVSRQSLNELKSVVAHTPLTSWLVQQATEEVRHRVKQAKECSMDVQARNSAARKRSNPVSKLTSRHSESRLCDTTGKVLVQGKNCKIRSAGEIVYAGKCNLYRFPLAALEAGNTVIIAVLADGAIIRWNAVAGRITGFYQHRVLGQRVFELLATEMGRRGMREQLLQAQKHTGSWDDYVAAGYSSPRAYRFRQASALYHVTLVLSVIPSCPEASSDVLLLLGREADNHAAANYVEDAARWMSDVLQPHLRAFQKRVESLERKEWNMSAEDGKRLVGHVQACNQLMERYLRLSSFNLESMNETWKPVRLHNFLRQFSRDVLPQVSSAGNRFTITFEEGVPKGEVFFDVEHVLEVLRRVVSAANKAGSNIHIALVVSVVEPVPSNLVGCESSSPFSLSQCVNVAPSPNAASSSLSSVSPHNSTGFSSGSSAALGKEGLRLCGPVQFRQVIDSSVSSSMRRICIVVSDNAEGVSPMKDTSDAKGGMTLTPTPEEKEVSLSGKSCGDARRLGIIKECEGLIAGMGGSLLIHSSDSDAVSNAITIELPLLPVPWSDDGDKECDTSVSFVSRSFLVIIADRDVKQRNNLCQLMWTRRHAVIPVTSLREVISKVKKGGADILVIDPLYLEATEEEYAALRDGTTLFDTLQQLTHLVVVLYADDFNDWRSRKWKECCRVIELPKPASASLLHFAMHEAERIVTYMREDEEQIALLRMAFSEFQGDRYRMGQLLGKGAFGEVYEVEDLLTGGKMAMKRMCLNNGVLADDIVQELVAMTSLRHENIIHYFYCQKESDTQLRLYMELASGGTLKNKIRKHNGPLPLEDIKEHLQDLCRGLAYLHSQNYVHCDIKTANALIDHHGRTKIGDFGTARRLKRPTDKLYTVVGTPQFMAPEVMNADISQKFGFNQKADIWSLGCVALELATGMSPFSYLECTRGMGIYMYVSKLANAPDLSPLIDGDPFLYTLIKNCLCVDPEQRPTAQELLHYDLLQGTDTNSRTKRLVQQVEMAKKLKLYAAIDQDGEDEEDEEDGSEVELIKGDIDDNDDSDDVSLIFGDEYSTNKDMQTTSCASSEDENNEARLKLMERIRHQLVKNEENFFASSSESSSASLHE